MKRKAVSSSGCRSRPANSVAPAGSYRSGGGGNEAVGAFETHVSLWRCSEQAGRNASERRAGLEKTNVGADLAQRWGRPPSLGMRGEAGIGRTTSDQNPAGHRGNDDGMSAHEDATQHGKPQAARARSPQPITREGWVGPPGMAERLVVPSKPGNSGGGKGP